MSARLFSSSFGHALFDCCVFMVVKTCFMPLLENHNVVLSVRQCSCSAESRRRSEIITLEMIGIFSRVYSSGDCKTRSNNSGWQKHGVYRGILETKERHVYLVEC